MVRAGSGASVNSGASDHQESNLNNRQSPGHTTERSSILNIREERMFICFLIRNSNRFSSFSNFNNQMYCTIRTYTNN
jgi:hypothetical protein